MKKLINNEKPDLVIITGDGVTGYEWDKSIDNWFEKVWKNMTLAFLETN